ncbi:uncharacterized protein IWZ02DRAFT_377592 [Phyllosticta citriasiana]|uniref:uncharacterized protein n=1 Tax=Phyllosticta citriasiana TaxID=595635 RepID=UPI0030FDE564
MAAEQAQAKVEASVFAITTAFTSGLDVFRKLRERRARRKKTRKAHGRRSHAIAAQEHVSDDESQLAKSLQRGPVEIQVRYELNRSHAGERFARGDATAHASLTEVLLKLNTGLVAIISSFLCHGKNDSNLDYKSLAHLSDCSRSDAIDALDQLYQRLSQSQVNLDSGRTCCPNCRSQKHADCGSVVDLQSAREQKPVAKKQSLVAVKPAPNGATPLPPTKSPKPRGSQSRLVMVRPRKSRLKPSSPTSAMQSSKPLATMPPRSRTTQHAAAAASSSSSSSSSALSPMPATTHRSHSRLRPPPPRHSSMPPIPLATPPPPQNPQPRLLSDDNTPSLHQQQPPPPPPPPRPRRTTVPVPASVYSFASDSTKLGEIPMARWAGGPWDAERAARLNAEAGWGENVGIGVAGEAEGDGKGNKKKRGGRGRFGALWRWGGECEEWEWVGEGEG